jgi:hypothetical protein
MFEGYIDICHFHIWDNLLLTLFHSALNILNGPSALPWSLVNVTYNNCEGFVSFLDEDHKVLIPILIFHTRFTGVCVLCFAVFIHFYLHCTLLISSYTLIHILLYIVVLFHIYVILRNFVVCNYILK